MQICHLQETHVEVTQALIEQSKDKINETVEQIPDPKPLKENQRETNPRDNNTLNIETKI